MARHSSSRQREEKSTREKESANIHSIVNSTRNSSLRPRVLDASLKRRARVLITNRSIPRQTRSLIRYALEITDPYLAQVVGRVEGGEMTIELVRRE